FLGAPSGLAILTTRPFSARSPFSSSTTKTRSPPCTIRLPTYGGHSAISHGLAATWDGTDTAAATVNKTTSPALVFLLIRCPCLRAAPPEGRGPHRRRSSEVARLRFRKLDRNRHRVVPPSRSYHAIPRRKTKP